MTAPTLFDIRDSIRSRKTSAREWTSRTLQRIERLEQLRVLENGLEIACDVTEDPTIGVDTPEDAVRFEAWLGA